MQRLFDHEKLEVTRAGEGGGKIFEMRTGPLQERDFTCAGCDNDFQSGRISLEP